MFSNKMQQSENLKSIYISAFSISFHINFIHILQLLPRIIHVDDFLHSFLLWDWLNVLIVCSKSEMFSQYILHLLDFNSAHCDDGCVFTFKGMLKINLFRSDYKSYAYSARISQLWAVFTSKGRYNLLVKKLSLEL